MAKKKIKPNEIYQLLILLVVVANLIVGLILVKQKQTLQTEAAGNCNYNTKSACKDAGCNWTGGSQESGSGYCKEYSKGASTYNVCKGLKCVSVECPRLPCPKDECGSNIGCMEQVPESEGGLGPDEDTGNTGDMGGMGGIGGGGCVPGGGTQMMGGGGGGCTPNGGGAQFYPDR